MTQTYRAETANINIDALFIDLLNKARQIENLGKDEYNNTLFTKTRKPLRAKYRGYGKTSYTKESYYKLYSELRPKRVEEEEASSIIDILFTSLSDQRFIKIYIVISLQYSHSDNSIGGSALSDQYFSINQIKDLEA